VMRGAAKEDPRGREDGEEPPPGAKCIDHHVRIPQPYPEGHRHPHAGGHSPRKVQKSYWAPICTRRGSEAVHPALLDTFGGL
jgi:hypothetical protein